MKPGDLTTIYEDPVTRQKPEGQAKLVKLLESYPDGSQDWLVRFTGEDSAVRRRIQVYEIHGVRRESRGQLRQTFATDPNRDAVGLYRRLPDQTLEWISDHPTQEDAQKAIP